MKFTVKYFFLTLSSDSSFSIYQFPQGLRKRKLLARGIKMQKNSQSRTDIFVQLFRSKVQLSLSQENT